MVLQTILYHWNELKLYFQMAGAKSGYEGKREARIIADTLNNYETKLYFLFLYPIDTDCERVNAAFQALSLPF